MKGRKVMTMSSFLIFLLLALFAIGGAVSARDNVRAPQRPSPGASEAQLRQWEGAYKQWARDSGNTKRVSGPETAGQPIVVGDKGVRLPADAYVDQFLISILCQPGTECPETPVYVLRRGKSTVAIEAPTGRVVHRDIAPGQEHAFAFLDAVVQGGDTP